ncbi:MAG TPA: hypothetical protein VMB81_21025 [Candidatus Sulfotelmatobacter sp.]|nr:hypothetical protein [Candidatus Sulfotelmatobacter sp.]
MRGSLRWDLIEGSGGFPAQRVAAQLDAVGGVDDAVEDGVGDGGVADQVVPAVDWDLAGDDGCAAAAAVFDKIVESQLTLRQYIRGRSQERCRLSAPGVMKQS